MTIHSNLYDLYQEVRDLSVNYCAPLAVEDHIPQPVDFVSPPKWHLGHTTWFYEEFILKKSLDGYQEFHPDFSFMFNSYYNAVGTRVLRANRGNMSRPTLAQVHEYRQYVDAAMLRLISSNSLEKHVQDFIIMGLNHEQQHQELLLTDIKYILGHNPLFPIYDSNRADASAKNIHSGWVEVSAGRYTIGADSHGFSYDNEHGAHEVYLHSFSISKALVTNAEYLEFMIDGGYHRHELWLDEGWAWINGESINAPLYWHLIDEEWHYYTLAGLKRIDHNALVTHVSHYEAAAFAAWKGQRLPTEFEWEVASNDFTWGQRWEHTASAYLPYPGYKKAEGAVGEYNGKFMMNQMVLRGASIATSPNHSRRTYRNFFHPHMRWQYTGIRLAKHD